MLDYIFSGIIGLVEELLSFVVDLFLSAFNFSKEQFDTVFPFAKVSYNLFQNIALLIVLFIGGVCVINILRSGDRNRETPVSIFFRAILAVVGIFLGNYILEGIIDFTMIGYEAIWNTNVSAGWPEANGMSLVISSISSVFYAQSILLYLILLIMIGYQLILVLLEAVERYLVLYVLLYLSPLTFSTLASSQTSQVFQRFLSMFISQCILMLLNIWAVKMALSVFASIGTIGHNETLIVPLISAFAFLRITQRFDTYLNQLGMNAALTGVGLGQDLLQSAKQMGVSFSSGISNLMGGGSSSGGGGVMGMAQTIAGAYGKVSPIAGMSQNVSNQAKAAGSTILGAVKHGADTAEAGGSFWDAAKDFYEGTISEARADADNKTQQNNVWANMAAAPEDYSTTTQAMATAVMDQPTELSNEELHLVQDRADVASSVMQRSQGSPAKITDNGKNAAMLHSLQVPESEDFVRAAYGSLENAQNVSTVTDRNGMRFAYETLGESGTPKMHSLEVKNHAQYNALSTQQRSAYKEFTAPDGTKKYYRMGSAFVSNSSENPAASQTAPPSGPSIPGKAGPDGGSPTNPSSQLPGDGSPQGIPEADFGDYSAEETERARQSAYRYHSGTDFSGNVTPAEAGEILDGYTNGGVPVSQPVIPLTSASSDGSEQSEEIDAYYAEAIRSSAATASTSGSMQDRQQANLQPDRGVSPSHPVRQEGAQPDPGFQTSPSGSYTYPGGEQTPTRHVNTQANPVRELDTDIERVYSIAKAAVPGNIPRVESVRKASQSADGIRLQTDTGAWELRPEGFVSKLPESQRKEYTKEYTSPQGKNYYTRFRSRWTPEKRETNRNNASGESD